MLPRRWKGCRLGLAAGTWERWNSVEAGEGPETMVVTAERFFDSQAKCNERRSQDRGWCQHADDSNFGRRSSVTYHWSH